MSMLIEGNTQRIGVSVGFDKLNQRVGGWFRQAQPTDMSKGYMYILECADGSYYTGSTKDLEFRLAQH